ncbi:MAG: YheT family hydrolase [Leptothrix sp. (in: b-proteobacteria)]
MMATPPRAPRTAPAPRPWTAPGIDAAATPDDARLRAPLWLPGGQAQTIWPALFSRRHGAVAPVFRRERWHTPDGDFVDADWLVDEVAGVARHGASDAAPDAAPVTPSPPMAPERPLLVLFHGLEGTSRSHYAQAFADWARRHGWAMVVPHFRGCSGELNLAPRAYHSGDFVEIGWMLQQARQRHRGAIVAVGVSLGGNALLRWGEESGHSASATACAIAAVCAPIDLAAAGDAIGRGLNRWIYTPMFLRTMKPKALAKLAQHPGLFDAERLRAARTLYEFDNLFTGPLHGFKGTDDYWRRASAKPALASLRLPTLVLNPLNDPFVPAASLPRSVPKGSAVTLWQPPQGGHVGFPTGAFPGHVLDLPAAVMDWLVPHLPPPPLQPPHRTAVS